MKLALPAQHTHASHQANPRAFHFQLSERSREVIFSLCCTLAPYAVAAIGVFAYHEQWLK